MRDTIIGYFMKPRPLFPSYIELKDIDIKEYPDVKGLLDKGDPWWLRQWQWAHEFLQYIGRNKSQHTFTRFRNEIERFLLWSYLIKQQAMTKLKKADILEYADFCWNPPASWICLANYEKFVFEGGYFRTNKSWAPFKLKRGKSSASLENLDDKELIKEKKKYRPSQQTLSATFTAVIAFYKYLINEEYLYGNPAQVAKADCRHFIKDSQVKEVKRLTEAQWQYVFETAVEMADEDRLFERNLFVICALKTLFLRISELSERSTWSPVMSHFWEDSDNSWWLKIYGKGRKLRDITVPASFIPYLKRYRNYRGLNSLPSPGEQHPIVEKIRGQGGMSSRQLTRIVQEVLDQAYVKMKANLGEDKSRKLKEASTHWLRHTGASMEIERGRALKDLSEDLGHASMATTDTVYVQTEKRVRAKSGKDRKVN